ncbi:hypothetical protein RZS08_60775 [Arthrospira platensis SPKY1]|nr:hypothetical protein [Arthrospira platensis SPKY1]
MDYQIITHSPRHPFSPSQNGERINDHHLTREEKEAARKEKAL